MCHTQPNPGPKVTFNWIVTFDWSINNPEPFQIDVRKIFKGRIPESWYAKKWNDGIRKQKVKLPMFPGRVFSVFAKVEQGNYGIITFN